MLDNHILLRRLSNSFCKKTAYLLKMWKVFFFLIALIHCYPMKVIATCICPFDHPQDLICRSKFGEFTTRGAVARKCKLYEYAGKANILCRVSDVYH